MNKKVLKDYAKLIVKMGVNVQKNQDVVINANVTDAYFVKYVVEEAYKAKARSVTVEWNCDEIVKLGYKYQTVKTMTDIPNWKLEKLQHRADTLPAMIHILSSDPDAMNGVDQEKMTEVRKINGPINMKYREMMDNKYQWTIVGIPGEAWAKKIFPNETPKKAMSLLWDAIIKVARVEGKPIENWKNHNKNIKDKCQKLNDLCIKKLTYKSKNGTDFTVGLHKETIFAGGYEATLSGVIYNPNMPTEECFTSPDKTTANGVVMSTKPLSVYGKLVDNFGFRFEQGKIVEVIAQTEEDKELLVKLTSMDEGAGMLGEVALVPYDSPINQTGLLFYNTLYDENACCHLAIGRAFNECVRDFEKKTEEEIKALDLNTSMIHVDFMIGSSDLSIVAETYDGKVVQIFENGTWAI